MRYHKISAQKLHGVPLSDLLYTARDAAEHSCFLNNTCHDYLSVITETNSLLDDFEVLFKVRVCVLYQEYFCYKSSVSDCNLIVKSFI